MFKTRENIWVEYRSRVATQAGDMLVRTDPTRYYRWVREGARWFWRANTRVTLAGDLLVCIATNTQYYRWVQEEVHWIGHRRCVFFLVYKIPLWWIGLCGHVQSTFLGNVHAHGPQATPNLTHKQCNMNHNEWVWPALLDPEIDCQQYF